MRHVTYVCMYYVTRHALVVRESHNTLRTRSFAHHVQTLECIPQACKCLHAKTPMPNYLREFIPAASAGCCACIFTNPLELVKTRMQLQGELKARGSYSIVYRNAFHASYTIAKHEGLLALQKGLFPALLYQVIMNGTRLSSYQIITNYGFTSGSDGRPVFLKCLLAGGFSGGLSAFLATPTMLVSIFYTF